MQIQKMLSKLYDMLQAIFLTGLMAVLPIAVTVFLFVFTFRLVQSWLAPLACYKPACLAHIPYIEFFLVIASIFFIGTILRIFLIRSLIQAAEQLIVKIPLVRPIYSGIKQLTTALTAQDKENQQQVVLIEFPRQGLYSIGFLMGKAHPTITPEASGTYYNIFVPTTPNPTTGFFIVVEEKQYKVVSLTRQEAMSLIISGGIIQPAEKNEQV